MSTMSVRLAANVATDVQDLKLQRSRVRKATRAARKEQQDELLVKAGAGPRQAKLNALENKGWLHDAPAARGAKRAASPTMGTEPATKKRKAAGKENAIPRQRGRSNQGQAPTQAATPAASADHVKVKRTYASERPRPKLRHRQLSPSEDEDDQLEQEGAEGYESSEGSFLLDNPEVEYGEEDEPAEDEEDNEDLSRTALRFAKERPQVVGAEDSDDDNNEMVLASSSGAPPPPPPPGSSSSLSPHSQQPRVKNRRHERAEDPNRWPSYLSLLAGGIKNQHSIIRGLTHDAIEYCELKVVTEHAFPEVENRDEFRSHVMVHCASILHEMSVHSTQYEVLYQRVKEDEDFRRIIGEWALDRISHARTLMRTAALVHINYYSFGDDEEGAARVKILLTGNAFVYPGRWGQDELGKTAWIVNASEAYLSPAIIKTIRRGWFDTLTAFGTQYTSYFTSSLDDKPEKEFTIPVVALAATAVDAALRMWQHGDFVDEPFKGERFLSVYESHANYLANMKTRYPTPYHSLMSLLYSKVRANHSTNALEMVQGDPFALFSGLDD
ncbi:hypothetical protein NP233_g4416 [Leucocoprinus birnbaumii]|uniref:DUF6532 domain-containing protein n=1 Tax=Leucocoprinus birnbaumii TaxID=56174 RepID=A0AAD5YVJ0_9AGAR|nr:hypothetical protein NP233_g4416 [Leucocoprinus birnbaumii]